MKTKIKILNEKEKQRILNFLKINYGIENLNVFDNYEFTETNKRIHIITKKYKQLIRELKNIADSIGFYLGKIEKYGFRLSFDACQLFSKHIKKFIEINEKQVEKWFKGENIDIEKNIKGFIVLKYKEDFIGCGYAKQGIIKNYVPKERRV